MSAAAILVMKLVGPNGPIQGESPMARFQDWIVLDSWKWSMNSSEQALRPGAISITKECDRASPTMMQFLDRSKECPSAEIMLWEGSEDSNLELSIHLTAVRLINLRMSVKNEEKGGGVDETWDLSYTHIKFKYYGPDVDASDVASKFVEAEFKAHPEGAVENADATKQKEFKTYFGKLKDTERIRLLKELQTLHDDGGIDPRLEEDDAAPDAKRARTALRDKVQG